MAKSGQMSVLDHLNELRQRLMTIAIVVVLASIGCFIIAGHILEIITRGIQLIYIRPAEALMAHIRIGFTAGLMLSTPIIFYQVIAFLMPALTPREKRVLLLAVFMMLLLFLAGLAFAWFIVFPIALEFFAGFAHDQLLPYYTISEYVAFSTGFLIAFGMVFQLPVVFWILGSLGVVGSRLLRTSRKYALVIIVILAAFITPPDVISQILMVGPMLVLYELGIWLVMLTERRRRKARHEIAS